MSSVPSEQRATSVEGVGLGTRSLALPALLLVFFVSGVSGLVYQVVWMRMLSLTFGVTSFAVATVLSGFMAGLALGAFLAGRLADRIRRPLLAYAIAEAGIALLGALSPLAFAAVREIYMQIVDALNITTLWPLTFIRFALAFSILLLPTTLMGATLPLMVRSSLLRPEAAGRNISLLYAVNTFGAAAGAFTCGFVLIGRFGLLRSLLIAAALNLIAALLAVVMRRMSADALAAPTDAHVEGSGETSVTAERVVITVFGISGAVSFAYEVVWARVLSIFFDATTYGFTVMLTMVLLGIGLGSWLLSPLISRRANWLLVFAGIEMAVGILGLLAVPLLANMVPLTDSLGLYKDPGALGVFGVKFMALVSLIVVFPPMLLLGMTFPIAARIVAAGRGDVGKRVGTVYSANVFGAISGSVLAGFVLLPRIGVQNSLILLGAVNVVLAVALLWVTPLRRGRPSPGVGATAGALGAAAVLLAAIFSPDLFRGIFRDRFANQEVVSVDEGLENMVAVADIRDEPVRTMYLNGQPQASTVPFVAGFHQLIGHTGMLVHPGVEDALVIGFGGGATPGAVAVHPGVQVEIIELSSAVTRAAPFFESINGGVLTKPNVHLTVDDGRNYLLLTDRRFDLITADIIRPRHAGASNLYSVEYYELAKAALRDNGVMVQWLEQLSERQYKLLLRSFVEVFPYVTVWADGALLVGSKQPMQIDRAALAAKFDDPAVAPALASVGLAQPQDFLDRFMGDRDEALAYLGDGPMVTDDRPYVEFYRSLSDEDRLPQMDGFSRDWRKVVKE